MATTDIEIAATGSIDHAPAAGTEQPAEQTQEGERELSPRERMMQAIVERAEEQRNRELAYGEEMEEEARDRAASTEHTEEPPADEIDPAVAAAVATVKDAVTPPEPPAKEPTRHLITVGGQQFSVTDDEMRQLAEMGAVANIAIRQHGGEQPQQAALQQAQPAYQPQQQPRQAPALDPEQAKAFHHKLTYGSEQDGIQAIQELYAAAAQAAAQPQVDPQRIAQAATNAALQQIQLQSNLNTLATEFPQVFADKGASQLAALKLHEIRQRDQLLGVQKPDLEAYREACRGVLEDARRLAGVAASQPGQGAASAAVQATPFADRDARKRAAPRTPTAASRKAAMGETAPRAPSASEIVEQMRRARFQPSMR